MLGTGSAISLLSKRLLRFARNDKNPNFLRSHKNIISKFKQCNQFVTGPLVQCPFGLRKTNRIKAQTPVE
jgi:hypothetical protein